MDTGDHYSALIAMAFEVALIVIAFRFMVAMHRTGAKVWQQMAERLLTLSIFLLIGQIFMFTPAFLTEPVHETLMMLVGDVFWVGAAYYGYRMIARVADDVGAMFGC